MEIEKAIQIKATKNLYLFFVACAAISCGYVLVTGKLNGDFLGMESRLNVPLLMFNLFCTVLPFFLLWKIYLYYKKKERKRTITIPLTFFKYFLLIIIFWNAIVTLLFGVGVMAAPPYEAPGIIKPIIQIMNRFNYTYGVFIYIFLSSKKDKFQFVFVFLLLILAYLRAGLGVFMYLGMIYYVKYYIEVNAFIIKRKAIFLLLLIVFPVFVSLMYQLRSALRNQETIELSDPITGRLIGRLSSFSDSALILQEAPYFFLSAQQLDFLYFQKQALGGIFSVDYMPVHRPEKMVFQFYYEESEDNVTYMAGTQGNLYISLFKSPVVLLLNVATILIYVYLTFFFFRLLRFPYANELAFILLLYVVMSGVSNEYAFLFFSIMVFVVLFLVVNLLKIKNENSLPHS